MEGGNRRKERGGKKGVGGEEEKLYGRRIGRSERCEQNDGKDRSRGNVIGVWKQV